MPEQNDTLTEAIFTLKEDVGYIKGKVDSIEVQTKKTNGRVNGHDKKITGIIIALVIIVVTLVFTNPEFAKLLSILPLQ